MLRSIPSAAKSPSPITPQNRKRGAQPGNCNARKWGTYSSRQPGPFYEIHLRIKSLQQTVQAGQLSPDQITLSAHALLDDLSSLFEEHERTASHVIALELKLFKLIVGAQKQAIPSTLRHRTLEYLALAPLVWIGRAFNDFGVDRDADSFFPVSKLSARNSPVAAPHPVPPPAWGSLPASHPLLATNLTDEQWALLAPLIPPDPPAHWRAGDPPLIIAANRWGFTHEAPTGEFDEMQIRQRHAQIAARFPALTSPPPAQQSAKKRRGRPRQFAASPRALLDAIIWKLATGHTWDALPMGFPPMRLCRNYYRRLYQSGRLYTLLLVLYNHLHLEENVDLFLLVGQGIFTTTPSQHIALNPAAPPTWQNYTALLFMQLARDALLHSERAAKRMDPKRVLLPVLKGIADLSDARLPELHQPPPGDHPTFQPLELSPAHKKWRQVERLLAQVSERTRRLSVAPEEPHPPGNVRNPRKSG